MNIQVNSIDYFGSLVNGPGVRSLLFLQGCDARCKGCHNPSTWDSDAGTVYDTDDLANILEENVKNRKITITGGEPLLQVDALLDLVKKLTGFNICIYTGRELESVPQELIDKINYIKVGKYVECLRRADRPYVGSTNQKFIEIKREGVA